MSVAVITGSAGLIGSEASAFFAGMGLDVVGIDNDMRKTFFGEDASTSWNRERLEAQLGRTYRHLSLDIRDSDAIDRLFGDLGSAVKLIVHTAAQPSHDWAARAPHVDFHVNAVGTLNLLEATRKHAPEAVFIFTSTNKVYGDLPNRLPLVEQELRFEIDPDHPYAAGIREDMSIDQSHAQRVRGVQGRCRRAGAGVRPVLWPAHRLLPRRVSDRARTTPAHSSMDSCRT